MTPTIYITTPIEVKPEKEGRYIATNGLGWFEVNYNDHYEFHEEFTDCSGLTHWLRPLPPDFIEKIAGEAWGACLKHSKYLMFDQYVFPENPIPDKQTTINQLKERYKL